MHRRGVISNPTNTSGDNRPPPFSHFAFSHRPRSTLLFTDHACRRCCAQTCRDHAVVVHVLDLAPFHDHHVLNACQPRNTKIPTPWLNVRFRTLPPPGPSFVRSCLTAFMWFWLLLDVRVFGRNDIVADAPSDRAATTGPRPMKISTHLLGVGGARVTHLARHRRARPSSGPPGTSPTGSR